MSGQPPELDVLGDEPRGRWPADSRRSWREPWNGRRRWVAAGVALVLVAGVATALILSRGEPERRLAWSALPPPPVPAGTVLNAISCPAPDECWIAGEAQSRGPEVVEPNGYLAHFRDGAWTVASDSSLTYFYTVNDVACRARDDCWAASGTRFAFGSFHYDGQRWRLVPPLRAADRSMILVQDVECRNGDLCVANVSGPCKTRPAVWNGSAWQTAPHYDTATPCLSTFTCTSVDDCDGFGFPTRDGGQPLRLETRGGAWGSTPFSTSRDYARVASSCPDRGSCVAVFSVFDTDDVRTEVVMLDGGGWLDRTVTNRGLPEAFAGFDVGCTSLTHCFLVGAASAGTGTNGVRAGLYQWSGQQWLASPLPAVADVAYLAGIDCTSNSLCWAVGVDPGGRPIVLKGTPE